MQRIAVAVLVTASGISAGCSGAPSLAPPSFSTPDLGLGSAARAYEGVTRRYAARTAACHALPRSEQRTCRDQAEARYVMATQELESLRRAEAPALRFARAP